MMTKRTKKERLTEREVDSLRKMLTWNAALGFQVEPIRGPLPDSAKAGRWIIRVRLTETFEVTLRELPGGYFQLDTGDRGPGSRPYCGTKDVTVAIEFAEEYLEGRRAGVGGDREEVAAVAAKKGGATFGDLLAYFPILKHARVASSDRYALAARLGVAAFGANTAISSVGENKLNAAVQARLGGVPSLGLRRVKLTTAEGQFRDLVTLVRELNHMHDGLTLVPECYLTGGNIRWINPEKERRAPAKTDGFEALMLPFSATEEGREVTLKPSVDEVDPTGRLRLFLAIAYYTGRRFSAILNLRWEDVVTDIWDIRRVLDRADLSTRDWAEFFPHGVLDFKRSYDKEDNHFVPPICQKLHLEIEVYARRCRGKRSGPLFPGVPGSDHPADAKVFRARPNRKRKPNGDWLSRWVDSGLYDEAMMLAARYIERVGNDPAMALPVEPLRPDEDVYDLLQVDPDRFRWTILRGYKFHRWRSAFATRMERFGYGAARGGDGNEGSDLDGHPSYIASWVPNDGSVRSRRYVELSPELIWLCANEVPAWIARPQAASLELARVKQMGERLEQYLDGQLTHPLTETPDQKEA